MSVAKKVKEAARNVKGKAKVGAGKATGDDRLAAEGRGDQAAAKVGRTADKAKDSVAHGAQSVKGKAKETAGKAVGNDRLRAKGKAEQVVAKGKEALNK